MQLANTLFSCLLFNSHKLLANLTVREFLVGIPPMPQGDLTKVSSFIGIRVCACPLHTVVRDFGSNTLHNPWLKIFVKLSQNTMTTK